MTPVYLSTGAFTGRVNGRNPRLIVDYADRLDCDGFEFLYFPDFEDRLDELIRLYVDAGLIIPVTHAEKKLGDYVSAPTDEAFGTACELLRKNANAAARLYPAGTPKLVAHCWGIPDSDSYIEQIIERVGILRELAAAEGAELYPENSFCVHGSPLEHFEALALRYPELHFIVDTRCAQFHGELERFTASEVFRSRVRHLHINDYGGGYKDWNAMYPILQPPRGNVDWTSFFGALRELSYAGTITLEAPSMLPDGVDCKTLNEGLRFIRNGLAGNP